jgi:hypothetical protein
MSDNFQEEDPQPARLDIPPADEPRPHQIESPESHPQDLSVERPFISEQIPPESSPEIQPSRSNYTNPIRTFFIAIAAWVVPGSGHLVQGRIARALAGFIAVGVMTFIGLRMHGNVFPPHADDAFSVLGFAADVSSGMFYFLAHTIEKAGPDVSRAAGDYGTRLFATAGVLNLLFVLDAMEISRGRKA